MHRSSATVHRRENWPNLGNSLALGIQRGVNSIFLQCILWPVACSDWGVCCVFDQLLMSDFWGKWPLKWKFAKMSFWIHRRDTKLCFVTKFGENMPLQKGRKVAWFTKQKTRAPQDLSQPHFSQNVRLHPKFTECCHPLTCTRTLNLVRIGCVLQDLFRKDGFFWPKKSIQYRLWAYNYYNIFNMFNC